MLLNFRKKYAAKKNIKALIGIDLLNKDKLIKYKFKSKRINGHKINFLLDKVSKQIITETISKDPYRRNHFKKAANGKNKSCSAEIPF